MVTGLMTKAEKVVEGTGLSFQLLFPRPLFYLSKFYLLLLLLSRLSRVQLCATP